jgi:prepilin-type N-terminal cleavage/methylation domain-containing protein
MMSALVHRRARRAESGFTMIELAITVMLMGIVLAVLFEFLNNTMVLTRRSEKDLQSEQAMTIALRTVTEDLRSASTISSCGVGFSFRWCVSLDIPRSTTTGVSCPERTLTYNLAGGKLYESELDYPAGACSPTTTKYTNRVVMTGLGNGATDYFLTWYDPTGVAFDPDASPSQVSTAGSIEAMVKANYISGANPIQLRSIAALRNHR